MNQQEPGRIVSVAGAVVAAVVWLAVPAAAITLNRDLAQYCIFAQQSLSLKNIHIDSACNVGVNCAQPTGNSACGRADFANPLFADQSQLASDAVTFNASGGVLWDLLTNHPFNAGNVMVKDGTSTFATPIIANTCDNACNADPSAIKTFCKFPSPFPPCNVGAPITASKGQDCSTSDTHPGNGVCDLGPGTYGDVRVLDTATINFASGDYDVCSLAVGQSANVVSSGGTVLNVAGSGFIRVGNQSKFGQQRCGDFTVRVEGAGTVNFGRNVVLAANVCAPLADIRLGHGNTLLGQFIGLDVLADLNDDLRFCGSTCTCP